MLRYIGRRLLLMIPVLIGITIIVQLLIDITPGDPAKLMLGSKATPEKVEELREELGLNDPLYVRYVRYMKGVFQGNFGKSFTTKRPVFEEMMERFPYTLRLVTIGLLLSLCVGVPIGVFAATHQYSWKDNIAMFFALFFVSMPSFWFALMLIQKLGVELRLLPIAGVKTWKGWILPTITMALSGMSIIARQTRSNMLEVIRQDYITTARAKGLSEGRVLYVHALKNAIIPVIVVTGGMFGTLLGGSMISEVIFSIPGLGLYTMTGLLNRDYPVIQSSVLILSTLFSLVILIVDIIFAFVDPRIRSQYTREKRRKREEKKGGAES